MRVKYLLPLFLGLLLALAQMRAQDSDVAVVVGPANRTNDITLADLRKVFAGERHSWAPGVSIKLLVRGPGTPERLALLRLLKMSESEYKQYWIAQVFRGEAESEPVVLPSLGMQIEALAIFPGAITLVSSRDVKPQMKVLSVDGKLPGEPGYALH